MTISKSLIDMYLGYFQAKGEAALKVICNLSIPSMVFLEAYKKLEPIEKMPEKEKKEMKQYVIENFPNKTIEQKLDICKIVYTIGTLL
jgi:hypothetical protein